LQEGPSKKKWRNHHKGAHNHLQKSGVNLSTGATNSGGAKSGEGDCTIIMFTQADCSGQTWGSYGLDPGSPFNVHPIDENKPVKSFSVSAGCGDVELFDDTENGQCNSENYVTTGAGCQNINSFSIQDDIEGVAVYADAGGRDEHCRDFDDGD